MRKIISLVLIFLFTHSSSHALMCAPLLRSSFVEADERDFFSLVESLRELRLYWQKKDETLDYHDFVLYLNGLKPLQRSLLLKEQRSRLSIHLKSKPWEHERYELALLGLHDVSHWIQWTTELFYSGKNQSEIALVGMLYAQLPNSLKMEVIKSIPVHWKGISKHNKNGIKLPSRRSADLFLNFILPPRTYFDKHRPKQAYLKYLAAVRNVTQLSEFYPHQIFDSILSIQGMMKSNKNSGSLFLYGSFPNGKATSSSDLDIAHLDKDSIKVSTYQIGQILESQLGRFLEISTSEYENKESLLKFATSKNGIVVEIREDEIYFHTAETTDLLSLEPRLHTWRLEKE